MRFCIMRIAAFDTLAHRALCFPRKGSMQDHNVPRSVDNVLHTEAANNQNVSLCCTRCNLEAEVSSAMATYTHKLGAMHLTGVKFARFKV